MPTAYPRVCGATRFLALKTRSNGGLSPRVRGNPSSKDRALALRGPIPACAGQPQVRTQRGQRNRAYPRVCGATQSKEERLQHQRGLSPRVRGNPHVRIVVVLTVGPIPACAGQPLRAWAPCTRATAYPRVCGATRRGTPVPRPAPGLSPRVRGNRDRRADEPRREGPIPACAGQP